VAIIGVDDPAHIHPKLRVDGAGRREGVRKAERLEVVEAKLVLVEGHPVRKDTIVAQLKCGKIANQTLKGAIIVLAKDAVDRADGVPDSVKKRREGIARPVLPMLHEKHAIGGAAPTRIQSLHQIEETNPVVALELR